MANSTACVIVWQYNQRLANYTGCMIVQTMASSTACMIVQQYNQLIWLVYSMYGCATIQPVATASSTVCLIVHQYSQ